MKLWKGASEETLETSIQSNRQQKTVEDEFQRSNELMEHHDKLAFWSVITVRMNMANKNRKYYLISMTSRHEVNHSS